MNFEAELNRLEEIALALDRADLSLDESLALFEEGIQRLRLGVGALARRPKGA